MSGRHKRLKIIFDTNVIISAEDGDRLDDVLSMNHDLFVAERTFMKELKDYKDKLNKKIAERALIVVKETKEIRTMLAHLDEKYKSGPSDCDKIALATAVINKFGHITTADRQLRRASEKEGIVPLYILDLIGFLLEEGKLTKDEAQKFYDDAFPVRKPNFEKMIQEQLSA